MTTKIKVNGAWKTLKDCWVKVNGTWRLVPTVYEKDGTTWKVVHRHRYTFYKTISTTTLNYNLRADAIASGWNGTDPLDAVITISTNTVVGSSSISAHAFTVGSSYPNGTIIRVINNGYIVGRGGNGGLGGGRGNGANPGTVGTAGGPALNAGYPVTVVNNGTIGGGGGGGGGGFGNWDQGGGPGGGGAGYYNGQASWRETTAYSNSCYLAGYPAGGGGPAIGFGNLSTAAGNIAFNIGAIPMLRNMHPNNSSAPNNDLIFRGSGVTQAQLTAMGIQTPLASIPVAESGDTVTYTFAGWVDHGLLVGYWHWNATVGASAGGYVGLVDNTYSEGGRQHPSFGSAFAIPANFGPSSILVIGCGDRASGGSTGMHDVYMGYQLIQVRTRTSASSVTAGTSGQGAHPGGNGGNLGQPGSEGSYYGIGSHAYGGAAGAAVTGYSNITWEVKGSVLGSTS